MGRIKKGILGGFSGTVGNVVGGNWKGIDYMRSQTTKHNYKPTQLQLEQQTKFALMGGFLQTMSGLLMESFRNYAVKMTGFNNAFSYNIKNGITGTYPAFDIDYPRVLVSRGDLPNSMSPAATAEANSVIKFTWTDGSSGSSGSGNVHVAHPTDMSILVVYCKEMNRTLYVFGGAARSAETDSIAVPLFTTKKVQTWMGFVSADGSKSSNSMYTGELTVQ